MKNTKRNNRDVWSLNLLYLLQVSLIFIGGSYRVIEAIFSILVVSYIMWSGSLDSFGVLQSQPTMTNSITHNIIINILIFTFL